MWHYNVTVVRGGYGSIAIKWSFPIDWRVHTIIGIEEKTSIAVILYKVEQAIDKAYDKPLFHFHVASRLIQVSRQIEEVCTDVQTGIKQSHTKLPNRIQTLD